MPNRLAERLRKEIKGRLTAAGAGELILVQNNGDKLRFDDKWALTIEEGFPHELDPFLIAEHSNGKKAMFVMLVHTSQILFES